MVLRNQLQRMQIFHIPEIGVDDHEVTIRDRNRATGEHAVRSVTKSLPRTLTLCARGTEGSESERLPADVGRSAEVARAASRGFIKIVEIPAVQADEAPAELAKE